MNAMHSSSLIDRGMSPSQTVEDIVANGGDECNATRLASSNAQCQVHARKTYGYKHRYMQIHSRLIVAGGTAKLDDVILIKSRLNLD